MKISKKMGGTRDREKKGGKVAGVKGNWSLTSKAGQRKTERKILEAGQMRQSEV